MPIAENELNAGLVMDMVYNPLETPLIKLAKQRGIPVISGMEMFVQQGARQFEIWTGKPRLRRRCCAWLNWSCGDEDEEVFSASQP